MMFNPLTLTFYINSGSKYGPITTCSIYISQEPNPAEPIMRVNRTGVTRRLTLLELSTASSAADDTGKPFWHNNSIWVILQYLHDGRSYIICLSGSRSFKWCSSRHADKRKQCQNTHLHTHTNTIQPRNGIVRMLSATRESLVTWLQRQKQARMQSQWIFYHL